MQKEFTLKRIASNVDGTFGVLLDNNDKSIPAIPFAVTIEPEWKQNKKMVSCVPAGTYECFIRKASTSRWDYNVVQLLDVPGRTSIQMHKGVTEDSSAGCIIVGEWFEPYKNKSAGTMQSTKGFKELMSRIGDSENIWLHIEKHY